MQFEAGYGVCFTILEKQFEERINILKSIHSTKPSELDTKITYGEMRKILEKENATWTTDKDAPDDEVAPDYPTGASGEGLLFDGEVEKIDLKSVLAPVGPTRLSSS